MMEDLPQSNEPTNIGVVSSSNMTEKQTSSSSFTNDVGHNEGGEKARDETSSSVVDESPNY